jgi:predicted P-loop ATPase
MRGKESYEALDGVWIMEMGELAALKKSDRDTIKNYISKREDTYRKAYARNTTINRRHTIFIGTTNESTFLEDDTGNRRYWVVDTDASKRRRTVWGEKGLTDEEVHQIWAEALEIYRKGESIMELSADERAAAEEEQDAHTIDDPYQGQIEGYLAVRLPHDWTKKNTYERVQFYQRTKDFEGEPAGTEERTVVSSAEIWIECLGNSGITSLTRADTKRIYRCLEKLGWKKSTKALWRGGEYGAQKCYEKPN